jgi:hypothetical protein
MCLVLDIYVESELQKLERLEKEYSLEVKFKYFSFYQKNKIKEKYDFGYRYKCVRFPDNGK